jgi:hypothetical protein
MEDPFGTLEESKEKAAEIISTACHIISKSFCLSGLD